MILRIILSILLSTVYLSPCKEKGNSSPSLRRLRNQFPLSSLTIPEYLKRYPSLKEIFLEKLGEKNLPYEYLQTGEKFKILKWYERYFRKKLLPQYSLSEIARRLVELFIHDIAFTLTFQEFTQTPPRKILDLGSGSAEYFRAFAHLFKDFTALVGIEKENFWVEAARKNINDFGLEDLGKYINVLEKDMFFLEEVKIVSDFQPYDLITLLHPNIFAPAIDVFEKEPEDIGLTYQRIILIKKLFQKIAQQILAENRKMVIVIDKTYVPEIHPLKEVENNLPSFLPNYLHYVAFVWTLRISGFSQAMVPATLIFPQHNPLEKTDLKLTGSKENIIQFIHLLERIEKVANHFTVNIALDLFRLTYGERFVGIEVLAHPELEPFLWELLEDYERKEIDKSQLAEQVYSLLNKK
ncbi:MAG: protein-L-isoaspartate O-methyltransferase [Candidatus Omnitrophica bacterium]|nr:protein-L-isoaspartate O-methyltransferase [Candidatus Omnitrophota bacterium]MCM8798045.1 protein-L-isoaspartate O-methyltransferase [Candidatus Omnitrophota bacterium]